MDKLNLPVTPQDVSSYTDFAGLARLKADAQNQSPETLKKVAQQFESLFLEMMLKSMRDAKLGDGIFDSDAGDFYQGMFDKQIAMDLASGHTGGLGIAELLVRQLGARAAAKAAQSGEGPDAAGQPLSTAPASMSVPSPQSVTPLPVGSSPVLPMSAPALPPGAAPQADDPNAAADWRPADPAEFVREVLPHAQAAAAALGVHPMALVAQAALETGWGRHMIPGQGGAGSSFNLFGIKATGGWEGAKVSAGTIEMENGLPVPRRASFRSYDSVADSFGDYVKLLSGSPRYREVLQQGSTAEGFAEAIGRSGYATDPNYASKIKNVLSGETLRDALQALKVSGSGPIT